MRSGMQRRFWPKADAADRTEVPPMRSSTLRSVALLTGVLVTAAPRAQAPAGTGTITGHVTLSHVRGTPLPSNVYAPRNIGNHQNTGSIPEIKNVLVYVKGVSYPGT